MKIELSQRESGVRYSSPLEAGDFIPYFLIENGERRLDIQAKAGNPVLLVFIRRDLTTEQIAAALALKPGVPVFHIAESELAHPEPRVFHSAAVYRLFMPDEARYSVCLCSRNLQVLHLARGNNIGRLLEQLPPLAQVQPELPPPILVVPNAISTSLAARLMAYLDDNEDAAFRNTGSYKSRSHIHPSLELELELDDKLCKSLLPELAKVFHAEVSHRETWKICRYDAADRGAFGKHRDTIDPHLHRRHVLTLVLNDDFEGGGISFPEYSDRIVHVPRYTAIVFPGSLYHQVKEIGRGRRYVIVSFLFTEAEARLKPDSERYRFRVRRDVCGIPVNRLTPLSTATPLTEAVAFPEGDGSGGTT